MQYYGVSISTEGGHCPETWLTRANKVLANCLLERTTAVLDVLSASKKARSEDEVEGEYAESTTL